MKKFEYSQFYEISGESIRLLDALNKLGQEGWELVSYSKKDIRSRAFPCAEEYSGILKREVVE